MWDLRDPPTSCHARLWMQVTEADGRLWKRRNSPEMTCRCMHSLVGFKFSFESFLGTPKKPGDHPLFTTLANKNGISGDLTCLRWPDTLNQKHAFGVPKGPVPLFLSPKGVPVHRVHRVPVRTGPKEGLSWIHGPGRRGGLFGRREGPSVHGVFQW